MQSSNGNETYQVQTLALKDLVASETNPRKNFDEAALKELAASITLQGVLQPILVRPYALADGTMNGRPGFEVVAGERRFRAAKIAGLDAIPAIVRNDIDDKAALEIQTIENLQREGLSPLEEARGYKAMLDQHGYTADSLAAKIGKSKSYVYARLKICNLPQACEQALERGDISPSIAELIGRLPSMDLREKLWKDEFDEIGEDWFQPPTYRDIKRDIERNYMRELKGAPFSQADKKLLPEAGSCKDCPKRTGNDRANYPDGRADVCTDTSCFDKKFEAHAARETQRLTAAGATVATKAEAEKLLAYGGERLDYEAAQKWVDLSAPCNLDNGGNGRRRTYGELLGDLAPELVVQGATRALPLVSREKAAELLRDKHGIELGKPAQTGHSDEWKKTGAKRRAEREIREESLRQAGAAVATAFANDFFGRPGNHGPLLRVLAEAVANIALESATAILARRGHALEPGTPAAQLSKYSDQLDPPEAIGLIAEIGLHYALSGWASWGRRLDDNAILGYARVDLKGIEKAVAREQKDAAKAKPAKAKPAKAKPAQINR